MAPRDITSYRLINQRIASTTCAHPHKLVAALGAMQAQDYASTLWAIGLRVAGATSTTVTKAIAERKIIRTWALRGTLHFTAAADVRWLLALLAPRMIARNARRFQQLELDAASFMQSRKALIRALQGGQQLARDEMYQTLERARVSTSGQRGYHILWRLAQEGILCFATNEGKQPTFTLLDEWLPASRSLDRDAALAELAQRYFTGHGPATLQDFTWWSGLGTADAQIALEMVAPQLTSMTIAGTVYWMGSNLRDLPGPSSAMHLLPGFDEYLLGYKDRGAVLESAHANKIVPGGNGVFKPTIVHKGRVVGTWTRTFNKDSVIVQAKPFKPLKRSEVSAFAEAAQYYGKFLGSSVVIKS